MKKLIFVIGILCLVSCASNESQKGTETDQNDTEMTGLELPPPVIPPDITDPAEKTAYNVLHFWDAMDFADTVRSLNRDFIEQNFVNFIYAFGFVSEDTRRDAARILLERARVQPEAYQLITEVAETYLFDPESPMASDELYIPFLEYMIESPYPDKVSAIRPSIQLEAAKSNLPGTRAADFDFVTRQGVKSSLYEEINGLRSHDSRLLLVFYDPDCEHCHEVMTRVAADDGLNVQINSGLLKIVAIYSGDFNESWQEDANNLPDTWIVGYEDGTVQDDGRFILRASPTAFLIGADKNVVAKDVRL
ncbi:MAG: DUF5106 domain-containing protein [Muribaculaceae bacterium]|nr:DUF5106 domain-containing protein [Muribaculaceae bacterium]